MDFEKSRDGEQCRGVIKKLFPSKRYGFVVCECEKHRGEAHFNYSDLEMSEQDRSFLIVGWRIEFNIVEQHKKTEHCDYRAMNVKPVPVMVVQCEIADTWENDTATLLCKELAGKTIYVSKEHYNGKIDIEAVNRRDTCRAAVTWEQIKQKRTIAIHCSQDTPAASPTISSPYRTQKYKTPEKRIRRDGGGSFSKPPTSSSSTTLTLNDEVFSSSFCDQNDTFSRSRDSGMVSPHESQGLSSSRSLGTPQVKSLQNSTPKSERSTLPDNCRLLSYMQTSPTFIKNNSNNSLPLTHYSPVISPYSDYSGSTFSTPRNLEFEFHLNCVQPQESSSNKTTPSPTNFSADTKAKNGVAYLARNNDTAASPGVRRMASDSRFGLYDHDHEVYPIRSPFKTSPEPSQNGIFSEQLSGRRVAASSSPIMKSRYFGASNDSMGTPEFDLNSSCLDDC